MHAGEWAACGWVGCTQIGGLHTDSADGWAAHG